MSATRAYHNVMEGVPSPLGAALMAYLGWKGTSKGYDAIAPRLVSMATARQEDPAAKQQIVDTWKNLPHDRLRTLFSGLGAAGLGLREAAVRADPDRMPAGIRSLLIRDPEDIGYKSRSFGAVEQPQMKVAADEITSEHISVRDTIGQVNRDRFLNDFEKLKTDSFIYGSDREKKGFTSGGNIARTAIRAGVGAVPGYAVGRTLARFGGLPMETRNRVGMIGGLAGALRNTGAI